MQRSSRSERKEEKTGSGNLDSPTHIRIVPTPQPPLALPLSPDGPLQLPLLLPPPSLLHLQPLHELLLVFPQDEFLLRSTLGRTGLGSGEGKDRTPRPVLEVLFQMDLRSRRRVRGGRRVGTDARSDQGRASTRRTELFRRVFTDPGRFARAKKKQ